MWSGVQFGNDEDGHRCRGAAVLLLSVHTRHARQVSSGSRHSVVKSGQPGRCLVYMHSVKWSFTLIEESKHKSTHIPSTREAWKRIQKKSEKKMEGCFSGWISAPGPHIDPYLSSHTSGPRPKIWPKATRDSASQPEDPNHCLTSVPTTMTRTSRLLSGHLSHFLRAAIGHNNLCTFHLCPLLTLSPLAL